MDVCVVSNSLSGGGAETTMRALNQEFNKLGMSSKLICLNSTENASLEVNEIQLNRIWKAGLLSTVRTLSNFRKLIAENQPRILIVNCELPELYAVLTPTKRIRLICVEHTSVPWHGRRALGVFVRFALLLKSVYWITVNGDQEKIWPFQTRCSFIANPLRPDVFESSVGSPNSPFVFMGRLRDEKDPGIVLRSAQNVGTKVEVFGRGELLDELSTTFVDSGIFHGYKDNPWKLISYEQVIVVSSKFEGDGLVVVESIARNQPILLRDVPDLRRFGLDEHHYFNTFESLVSKMQDVVKNGPLGYAPGKQKAEEFLSMRSMNAVAKQWKSYLDNNF